MDNLLEVGGSFFYIDIDSFTSILTMSNNDTKSIETESKVEYDQAGTLLSTIVTSREYDKGQEIDGPKYDIVRMCLEILLTNNDDLDDKLGFESAMGKTSLSFKIAFNTLLEYGIIKEIE